VHAHPPSTRGCIVLPVENGRIAPASTLWQEKGVTSPRSLVLVGVLFAATTAVFGGEIPLDSPTGGANSPPAGPPQKLILGRAELVVGGFRVEIPTGSFHAPAEGAASYSVPGPIVRCKGPDGVWRGHGYLETYPRLLKFNGTQTPTGATLTYEFEAGKRYEVQMTVRDGVLVLEEQSSLGPRNLFVFDCFYSEAAGQPWAPSAGIAFSANARTVGSLYLPCFYDKPEVTVNPGVAAPPTTEMEGQPPVPPIGVAVFASASGSKDLIGFWAVDPAQWKHADAMGFQLWQHRQRAGDPSSRSFLGPDTKSDSTPNARTASLMGTSLYEGHVTIEFNLGVGTRKLAFAAPGKGPNQEHLAGPLVEAVRAVR